MTRALPLPIGTLVRFTVDNLGGSPRDELHRVHEDLTVNRGDVGVVAFGHPNPKLRNDGWFYVETAGPDEPMYVGVTMRMVERVS